MDEKNLYNIYYMSSIQIDKISGIRPDFFQIFGKSSIRPDSKNHYPVHVPLTHSIVDRSTIVSLLTICPLIKSCMQ